jgi:hypothetical protein
MEIQQENLVKMVDLAEEEDFVNQVDHLLVELEIGEMEPINQQQQQFQLKDIQEELGILHLLAVAGVLEVLAQMLQVELPVQVEQEFKLLLLGHQHLLVLVH